MTTDDHKKKIEHLHPTLTSAVQKKLDLKSVQCLSVAGRVRLLEKEFNLSAGVSSSLVRLHQLYIPLGDGR